MTGNHTSPLASFGRGLLALIAFAFLCGECVSNWQSIGARSEKTIAAQEIARVDSLLAVENARHGKAQADQASISVIEDKLSDKRLAVAGLTGRWDSVAVAKRNRFIAEENILAAQLEGKKSRATQQAENMERLAGQKNSAINTQFDKAQEAEAMRAKVEKLIMAIIFPVLAFAFVLAEKLVAKKFFSALAFALMAFFAQVVSSVALAGFVIDLHHTDFRFTVAVLSVLYFALYHAAAYAAFDNGARSPFAIDFMIDRKKAITRVREAKNSAARRAHDETQKRLNLEHSEKMAGMRAEIADQFRKTEQEMVVVDSAPIQFDFGRNFNKPPVRQLELPGIASASVNHPPKIAEKIKSAAADYCSIGNESKPTMREFARSREVDFGKFYRAVKKLESG